MIMIKPDHVKQNDEDTKCRLIREFKRGSFENLTESTKLQNVPARNSSFIYQQKTARELIDKI